MNSRRSTLPLVTVLALALGAASFGCGPQKAFCPNIPSGNCPVPVDSAVDDAGMDAPAKETGSVTVSDQDAAGH